MKDIIKKGKIEILKSDSGAGGLSQEVHLIIYKNKKYVLRKCDNIKTSKNYEQISKIFEHKSFLPYFLGRYGKDLLYDYIKGRDLTKNENEKIIGQIGIICAEINKIKVNGDLDKKFEKDLQELISGKFSKNKKVIYLQKKKNINAKNIKSPLKNIEGTFLKKLYFYLKNKTNPLLCFDANDLAPSNFRLKGGKVYFVDIGAIKKLPKGFGIAKAYSEWFNNPHLQKYFEKGYNSISSMDFFNSKYKDYCFLYLMVQQLNFKCQVGRDFSDNLKILYYLLKKYKSKLKNHKNIEKIQ